jgi:rubrerythrin
MLKPLTLAELNDLAIALEHSSEALYRELAAMFAHEPDVSQFWTLMADEEVAHAEWLGELRKSLEDHQLQKQVDSRFSDAAWELLQISPKARLRNIKNLDEAYEVARDFESAETNAIFDFLISDYLLATRAKDFLHSQVGVHVERLNKGLPIQFQGRSARLAITAKR